MRFCFSIFSLTCLSLSAEILCYAYQPQFMNPGLDLKDHYFTFNYFKSTLHAPSRVKNTKGIPVTRKSSSSLVAFDFWECTGSKAISLNSTLWKLGMCRYQIPISLIIYCSLWYYHNYPLKRNDSLKKKKKQQQKLLLSFGKQKAAS